eukprot:6912537-Lingulodinium_polyedra.AAC.1
MVDYLKGQAKQLVQDAGIAPALWHYGNDAIALKASFQVIASGLDKPVRRRGRVKTHFLMQR